MSRKSTNSESAKKFKKIRNDLMNFERDEIIKVKNSNKDIKITKFEDSNNKIPNSKYSLTSKNLEQVKFEGVSPNIEIVKCNDNGKDEKDEVNSSDLSDEGED